MKRRIWRLGSESKGEKRRRRAYDPADGPGDNDDDSYHPSLPSSRKPSLTPEAEQKIKEVARLSPGEEEIEVED